VLGDESEEAEELRRCSLGRGGREGRLDDDRAVPKSPTSQPGPRLLQGLKIAAAGRRISCGAERSHAGGPDAALEAAAPTAPVAAGAAAFAALPAPRPSRSR